MTNQPVGQLVNLSTGAIIAQLDDDQLKMFHSHLEQESATDTTFFIVPSSLDWMRQQGDGELCGLLQAALGDSDELIVGLAPVLRGAPGRVQGRLLALKSKSPLIGYKVEAYDKDVFSEYLLSWGYTNAEGRFEIQFDESAFNKPLLGIDLEREPDIKLVILAFGPEAFLEDSLEEADAEDAPADDDAELASLSSDTAESREEIDVVDIDTVAQAAGVDAMELPEDAGSEEDLMVGAVGMIRGMETNFGDIYVSDKGELIAPALDQGLASICPQCGATFRSGFEMCGDCNMPLRRLV